MPLLSNSCSEPKFDFPPEIFPGRKIEERISKRAAFLSQFDSCGMSFISDAPMFKEPVVMKVGNRFDVVFDQRAPAVPEWSVIRTLLVIADRTQDCVRKLREDVLAVQFAFLQI
jgi:hypothetical protein